MPEAKDLEPRVRNLEIGEAEHNAKSEGFWTDQQKFNKETTRAMTGLADSLTKLNMRIIYVIGVGSGIGVLASGVGAQIARALINQ